MKIPRKNYFGKLTPNLFRALEAATTYAKLKGHVYVELSHWLWQFWQIGNTDLHLLANHYRLNPSAIEAELRRSSEQQASSANGLIDFGPQIFQVLEKSWLHASLCRTDSKVRSAWLLEAILSAPELTSALHTVCPTLAQIVPSSKADEWSAVIKRSVEQNESAFDRTDLEPSVPGENSQAIADEPQATDALSKYCTDLTDQARQGKLDPVIGRDHEIRTMVDILLRRRQNNPLLTGEAGVGKTAVVEGLAIAIAERRIPPSLFNVRVLSLDVGSLIAGASMRGEFESRLKNLLHQIQNSDQAVILFIDEIHTLVGAGGQAGTGDAANLLKPALARGGLRTVGATTWGEFKKYIEKDPALTRRFQVLQVQEPQPEAAAAMLRVLGKKFSQHHGVLITDAAVRAAVELSHRYMPTRQLPDKAISLLDTACARVAMSLHTQPPELINLEQQMLNLETQIECQALELIRHPEQAGALGDMQVRLNQLKDTHREKTERLTAEKSLVVELLEQWQAAQAGASKDGGTVTTSPILPPWLDVKTKLDELQGDAAFVFPEVSAEVVAHIVSDWTGIPAGRMLADEKHAMVALETTLSKRIKGQPNALKTLSEQIQIAKSGLSNPDKPIGVFLLVGPSGVGKTETALALAEAVYGGEQNLITINMSEFQEAHTVSSLKGAPPGYVGYGEGGVLTEAARRRPYSVILLDEIEKAHPDVHEVFYQVFDKGWMEDGEGRFIDFKNTLILMTSNAGAELLEQLCADEATAPDAQGLSDALQPELRKTFPAAFLGRITITPYLPLSAPVIAEIADLQLDKVIQRIWQHHHIPLTITPSAREAVQQSGGALEIGGRRIAKHIERKILPVLSMHWLQMPLDTHSPSALTLDWSVERGYWLFTEEVERSASKKN